MKKIGIISGSVAGQSLRKVLSSLEPTLKQEYNDTVRTERIWDEVNMQSLDECYRDTMYSRRREAQMNFDDLATVLNCNKQYMVDAQIGKPIPSEVYSALLDWLERE